MTEQEKAEAGSKSWHPIMRLIIENPISALNAGFILFGGGIVYAQIGSYMSENDTRVTRIEQQLRESNIAANIKDDRTNLKFEAITQRLNDVAVTTARTDERIGYLIQQMQQQQRNERRGPQ